MVTQNDEFIRKKAGTLLTPLIFPLPVWCCIASTISTKTYNKSITKEKGYLPILNQFTHLYTPSVETCTITNHNESITKEAGTYVTYYVAVFTCYKLYNNY